MIQVEPQTWRLFWGNPEGWFHRFTLLLTNEAHTVKMSLFSILAGVGEMDAISDTEDVQTFDPWDTGMKRLHPFGANGGGFGKAMA